MLKFHRYLRSVERLPFCSELRLMSKTSCPRTDYPCYECKQPDKKEEEEYMAYLKESILPKVFETHPERHTRIYKILVFIGIPIVICGYINMCYLNTKERKRPKFVEYSYLRIRRKPYPWHPTRTLFHHPRYNALPTGYEIEVPEEEEYDPLEPEKK